MDVSDDDEPSKKKHRTEAGVEEKNNLKDENDSLRCQMEAYKNEVKILNVLRSLKLVTEEDRCIHFISEPLIFNVVFWLTRLIRITLKPYSFVSFRLYRFQLTAVDCSRGFKSTFVRKSMYS